MIDRTGQVWRKIKMHRHAPFDIVVLRSEKKTLQNKDLDRGTNHIIVRHFCRNHDIEVLDWFEPDESPWEKNTNLVRIV